MGFLSWEWFPWLFYRGNPGYVISDLHCNDCDPGGLMIDGCLPQGEGVTMGVWVVMAIAVASPDLV